MFCRLYGLTGVLLCVGIGLSAVPDTELLNSDRLALLTAGGPCEMATPVSHTCNTCEKIGPLFDARVKCNSTISGAGRCVYFSSGPGPQTSQICTQQTPSCGGTEVLFESLTECQMNMNGIEAGPCERTYTSASSCCSGIYNCPL